MIKDMPVELMIILQENGQYIIHLGRYSISRELFSLKEYVQNLNLLIYFKYV